MRALLQTGSSGRVPVPPEKRFLVSLSGFLLFWAAACAGTTGADTANILAVYGDAIAQKEPPPGWAFEWNAGGALGTTECYGPLSCAEATVGRRVVLKRGVLDATGALRPDLPSQTQYGDVSGIRDRDGVARCAIAAYAMPSNSSGEVWVNHGNLWTRHSDGVMVEIYLNDERKFRAAAKKGLAPLLFQTRLGQLRQGDTVRVAVGPSENRGGGGGGRLRFVVEEWPLGTTPGQPVNILAPPIDTASPVRDADGGFASYRAKHQIQCGSVITNRPELVFIGDSITVRWPIEMLNAKYGKYRPVTLGVAGDWVQNVLWRVLNGTLDQAPVKVIVLLIGTNNLSNGFPPEEVAAGIARLIEALQEKASDARVLLMGIFPRGGALSDPGNIRVRQTNARLELLADNQKVFFLDIGDKFAEPDGTITAEVMPDQLHVATPGFVRWLDAMSPTLDKLLETP